MVIYKVISHELHLVDSFSYNTEDFDFSSKSRTLNDTLIMSSVFEVTVVSLVTRINQTLVMTDGFTIEVVKSFGDTLEFTEGFVMAGRTVGQTITDTLVLRSGFAMTLTRRGVRI